MNPAKESGFKDGCYGFGLTTGCDIGFKSDVWHDDLDEILASFESSDACEKPQKKVSLPEI